MTNTACVVAAAGDAWITQQLRNLKRCVLKTLANQRSNVDGVGARAVSSCGCRIAGARSLAAAGARSLAAAGARSLAAAFAGCPAAAGGVDGGAGGCGLCRAL